MYLSPSRQEMLPFPRAHYEPTINLIATFTPSRILTVQCRPFTRLEMWANAQRDGRPAEYRWRPLFNAAKFD